MEFLYNAGDWVIFNNTKSLTDVDEIIDYVDSLSSNGVFNIKKEFSYSYDNENFSPFLELNSNNLKKIDTYKVNHYLRSDILGVKVENDILTIKITDSKNYNINLNANMPFKLMTMKYNPSGTLSIYRNTQVSDYTGFDSAAPFGIDEIFEYDKSSPNNIFIKFKYTLISGTDVSINSVNINYKAINNINYSCVLKTLDTGCNTALIFDNTCNSPALQLNSQNDSIKCLYQSLNTMIASIASINVDWFRFTPVANSEDVVFHEYTLYSVEMPKSVKIILPSGKIPENKPEFNKFDLDWDMPFEIHVPRKEWESVYGRIIPQKRDIVWIAKTNKIWEISSSYLQTDFGGEGMYYKVFLTKYQNRSNAFKSQEITDILDEKINSQEDIFGEMLDAEILNASKPELNIDDNMYDDNREYVNVGFNNQKILNYYTTVANNSYNLSSIIDNNIDNAIKYKIKNSNRKNIGMSFWFRKHIPTFQKTTISNITYGVNSTTFNLTMDSSKVSIGETISISNETLQIGFIATIQQVINSTSVRINVTNETSIYLSTKSVGWNNNSFNWNKDTNSILLNSFVNNSGVKIILNHNQYLSQLSVLVGSQEFIYYINNISNDKWYGMVLNISNEFNSIETNIWKIQWNINTDTPKTNKLENIFNKIDAMNLDNNISSNINWTIPFSNTDMANIRIYNSLYPFNTHSKLLNSLISNETENIILNDICNEMSYLPRLKTAKNN